ncbi:MAG TPA: twin-arginine translocation signal domain-containing protein [Bryobacteraceae bacterium]|nr:twin-arginine translocation signal domain-containing protein [Bryobacteraceae bacterium]
MPNSRRGFLQAATVAAALSTGSSEAQQVRPAGPPYVQVPRMKFGGQEISRLVAGCNPFYGFAHFNTTLAEIMREYFTQERVCEVLHQCNRYGINAHNFVLRGRAQADIERFRSEGGKMHLIVQGMGDPAEVYRAVRPLAIYHHGEVTDRAYQAGDLKPVKEWCKRARDLGVMVGVGTHKPEVLSQVEEEGWDVDFYAGCVYNRTRSTDEWKQVLNNELVEMQGDCYLRSDPPRMYQVMRQTRKPCFAFKILAAGRIDERGAEQAFRTAFGSIKPIDGVFVGMFPRVRDEVRENAELVRRIVVAS